MKNKLSCGQVKKAGDCAWKSTIKCQVIFDVQYSKAGTLKSSWEYNCIRSWRNIKFFEPDGFDYNRHWIPWMPLSKSLNVE